ncbi:hypothetical protein EX30DRAFT_178210 [Ascodesmis nigricans]|uniref:Uncharacterized protein n=1 Tax=Ascodesmis nigricans TaxID=341454 RepID=A0A4S2MLA8_9PEZI|nr:hypothetical protein EX30DRAFT_178210 [Ascodesmis nigricans]
MTLSHVQDNGSMPSFCPINVVLLLLLSRLTIPVANSSFPTSFSCASGSSQHYIQTFPYQYLTTSLINQFPIGIASPIPPVAHFPQPTYLHHDVYVTSHHRIKIHNVTHKPSNPIIQYFKLMMVNVGSFVDCRLESRIVQYE